MSDNEPLELLAKRIQNYTTGELVHIMRNVQEPVARNVLLAQLFDTKAAPSIAAVATTPPKVKKGVNGFIGYRCTYSYITAFDATLTNLPYSLAQSHTHFQDLADEEHFVLHRSAVEARTR